MKNYLFLELDQFLKRKKNQIVFLILVVSGLYFSLIANDNYDPIEKVNTPEITTRYNERKEFLENVQINENTHYMIQFAADVFPEWNNLDKTRLDALDSGDFTRYAEKTADWYVYSDNIFFQRISEDLNYNTRYYQHGNYFAHFDGHYGYKREAAKYLAFSKLNTPLSINAFEERTAFQTVYRLSQTLLPLIILTALLFLSSDILTKDRNHRSLIAGYPVTPFARLIVKTFLLVLSLFSIAASFLPAFVIIGCKYGFGRLNYPIPIYHNNHLNNGTFTVISLGKYLLIFGGLLLILALLIIFLVIMISQLFKSDMLNILIGLLLIWGEYLYYRQGIGEYSSYEWLPSSFTKIGEIITGHHNYLYVTTKFTVPQALLVLVSSLLITFLLSYFLTKRKESLH